MGPSTQTSTSTTTPLSPQVQPTLDKLLTGVQQAYDKGPSVFDEDLYPGVGTTTLNSWQMGRSAAANPAFATGLSGAFGNTNNLISGGGLTSGMQGSIGATNAATSGYGGLASSGGLTDAMKGNIADVGNIGQGYAGLADAFSGDAPGYQTMRQNILDDAIKNVQTPYLSSPGLLGSRSYVQDATKAAVDAIAPLDYQNFQNDVSNRYNSLNGRLNAANTGFNMGQTGVGNQLSALGGQLAGAGQGFNMGQQGIANAFAAQDQLPSLLQSGFLPSSLMGQIGAAEDADALAKRQNQYDRFERVNNAQTDLLAKLSAILSGNAAAGGTQTIGTQPGPSPMQTIGSLLLGGLALA